MKSERIKPSACPHCGKVLDCASCLDEPEAKPKKGDLSVCVGCNSILAFEDDLSLRSFSHDELNSLPDEHKRVILRTRQMALDMKSGFSWKT